ncbi:hypothetical protein J6590_079810 [Homalodisca vitripennis]|nr:hypothetical protein J6590_079810 [Homalodisca vitripennis]
MSVDDLCSTGILSLKESGFYQPYGQEQYEIFIITIEDGSLVRLESVHKYNLSRRTDNSSLTYLSETKSNLDDRGFLETLVHRRKSDDLDIDQPSPPIIIALDCSLLRATTCRAITGRRETGKYKCLTHATVILHDSSQLWRTNRAIDKHAPFKARALMLEAQGIWRLAAWSDMPPLTNHRDKYIKYKGFPRVNYCAVSVMSAYKALITTDKLTDCHPLTDWL